MKTHRHWLLLVIVLAGCQTAAQRTFTKLAAETAKSMAEANACSTNVRAKPEYSEFVKHIPDDQPSLAQLDDGSFLSRSDRPMVLAFYADLEPCRQMTRNAAQHYNSGVYVAILNAQNDGDKVRLSLLRGQITWGQYAQAIQDTRSKSIRNMEAADQVFKSELQSQHERELAQRASAAAAFSEMQQRQQVIDALNRPVNTSCTNFGNQTNCRTY